MSTDDNNGYEDLDKSDLKFIYEQFLRGECHQRFLQSRLGRPSLPEPGS